jgi:creatinine amidohydrolase
MPRTRHLADLRAPEVADAVGPRSIVVVPLGAVEQHGPHLPFSTDLIVAHAAADAVVDRFGDEHDLFVLPPLAFTRSSEHAWSAGTVWLSTATMLAVLGDIGRSLATAGARKLAFVNAHGGNTSLLNVACRDLRLAHGVETFLLHPFLPPDHGGGAGAAPAGELGMGIHAGHDETSMILHLRPDLVDMGVAEANVPAKLAANRHVRFGGSVSFGWLSDDFGPSGVIGDPTGASAEHGAALFDAAVDVLGEAFGEIARFAYPMR